jgi:FtsP/CotA-like multicopper oxidase with cupredoxin domain
MMKSKPKLLNTERKIVKMKTFNTQRGGLVAGALLLVAGALNGLAGHSTHLIDGITGPSFTLAVKDGYLSTGEGNSVYFWGYANGAAGKAQYSGPTLIVNQGALVTVTLVNYLTQAPVSIVFPGQSVSASGGSTGLLTQEAAPATKDAVTGVITPSAAVAYTFTASKPGTYLYHSGTRPDLQIEMGLIGALIVRPTGFDPANSATWRAYDDPDPDGTGPLLAASAFEHEYLFLNTEMDAKIHELVEQGQMAQVDTTKWWPVYWFLNGRTAPDTMLPAAPGAAWLPHQPYDCLPVFNATDKVLLRVIGGGRDLHPFHTHGNHALVIAKDGRPLSSTQTTPSGPIDLAQKMFTIPTIPGGTWDAIFEWNAAGLGWDIYGHTSASDPLAVGEDPADHGKPIPVKLPSDQQMTFGQFYGGSPFLGAAGTLPPGDGGFNPGGALMFMWHSHSEKELVNYDIFPGGMLTMAIVLAHPAP